MLVALEQSAAGDDVNSGTEHRGEFVDEVYLVQERSPRFELDEEVHVARRAGAAPGGSVTGSLSHARSTGLRNTGAADRISDRTSINAQYAPRDSNPEHAD